MMPSVPSKANRDITPDLKKVKSESQLGPPFMVYD